MSDNSAERSLNAAVDAAGDGRVAGRPGSTFMELLAPEVRSALIECSTLQILPRRHVLFSEGDGRSNVYVLRSGRVKLSRRSVTGTEVITALCGPGEHVGFSGLSHGGVRLHTAQVVEAGEACVLSEDDFRTLLRTHPSAAMAVIEALRNRLVSVTDALTDMVSEDVPSRLVRLLRRLARSNGDRRDGQCVVDVRLTHQELANMIGARRQTVTTAINDLHRNGVLLRDQHLIVVRDPIGAGGPQASVRS